MIHFNFANDSVIKKSEQLRDSLAYGNYQFYESSDSIQTFISKYPNSLYYTKATQLYFDLQYREQVSINSAYQLKQFISYYPLNPNKTDAEQKLYELTLQLHNADSLHNFIKQYSTTLTSDQAWKYLYGLSVKNYSAEELNKFSKQFPDYPHATFLEKEISMTNQLLLPLADNTGKYGYIDTLGRWIITAQFDDAEQFIEGNAAVCKNDSCFYINKEGLKLFDAYFDDIYPYKQGIAIIKKNNLYYLLNRSGQLISKGYQEMNSELGNLYVCKNNGQYGAINIKGEVIIPFNYNKLGDFKNGFTYYFTHKYGLISKTNNALNAYWDWVSEVDTNQIVLIKKDNVFGLMRTDGDILVSPHYDYIEPCANRLYLVVKKGLYGFYNANDFCYATAIEYDYNNAYKSDYYTNGSSFKLLKNSETALVDANGRLSINFGTYSNLYFAKNGLIRVQKNDKFGFVDRSLKPIATIAFDKATDFDNDVAIVYKSAQSMLINKTAKVVFQLKEGKIEKLHSDLFKIEQDDLVGLINQKGEIVLLMEYDSIHQLKNHFYVCLKPDKSMYLFNSVTKKIINII